MHYTKLHCVGLIGLDVLLCMEDFRWPGAACLNSERETHVFRDLQTSKERKTKEDIDAEPIYECTV